MTSAINDVLMSKKADVPRYAINEKNTAAAKEIHERIERSKEFIDKNLQTAIPVKKMAAVAYMSVYHYSRAFKSIYKVSPYRYYVQKKIEQASICLLLTDLPVTTVAYNFGFKDLNSFSRMFRRTYHYSPSEFRLHHAKKSS